MATGFGLFQQQAQTVSPGGEQAEKKAKLAAKITALNDHFLQWVQRQNKKELWLDGVEDYIEYAKQISNEFKDVIDGDAPEQKSGGFFYFSAPQGFGAGAAATRAAPAADDDHDQQQQEEKNDDDDDDALVVDTSKADVLYSLKLHLLTQDADTKKWKDKGTGTFSLRQSKPSADGDKAVSYIVFAAASGKVLINAPVLKGLKPMINPKSPANVVMFLISKEEDGSDKKEMHLFKCGSAEVAKEVVAKVGEQA